MSSLYIMHKDRLHTRKLNLGSSPKCQDDHTNAMINEVSKGEETYTRLLQPDELPQHPGIQLFNKFSEKN